MSHSSRPLPLFLVVLLAGCSCNGDQDIGGRDRDGSVPRSIDGCGDGLDGDGDGRIDEDCYCTAGEAQECFPTGALGACGPGAQTCDAATGTEWGQWSGCEGAPRPGEEQCEGAIDEDCDGSVDEGCPCDEGATAACGAEFTQGACRPGTQACRGGSWTGCEGAIFPMPEQCGDGIDDDCDGTVDEPSVCDCRPGPELCDNGEDDDCDGIVDEPDACTRCTPSEEVCGNDTDDDCDARVDEGTAEICGDGIDQDCDGSDLPCAADGGVDSGPVTAPECGDGSAPAVVATFPSEAIVGSGGRFGDRRPMRRIGDDVVVRLEYASSGVRLERATSAGLTPATEFTRFVFSYWGDHRSPWILTADDTLSGTSGGSTGLTYLMRTADLSRATPAWTSVTPREPARPGHLTTPAYVAPAGDRFLWLEDVSDNDVSVNPDFTVWDLEASSGSLTRLHSFGPSGAPGSTHPPRAAYLGSRDGRDHHWWTRDGQLHVESSISGTLSPPVVSLSDALPEGCSTGPHSHDDTSYYVSASCRQPCASGRPGCAGDDTYFIFRVPFEGGEAELLWRLDAPGQWGGGFVLGPQVDDGPNVYFALDYRVFESASRVRRVPPYEGIIVISKTPGSTPRGLPGSRLSDFAVGPSCVMQLDGPGTSFDQLIGWPR